MKHTYLIALTSVFALHVHAQTGWTIIPSGTTRDLHAIDDPFPLVIVGDEGTLIRTADGGLSWTALSSGTSQHLYDVAIESVGAFYLSGDSGTFLRASSAGTVITDRSIAGLDTPLRAVSVVSSDQPMVVSEDGYLGRSTNGGISFNAMPTGNTQDLQGISGPGNSFRMACGANGTLIRSVDGGLTWSTVNSGVTTDLFDVYTSQSFASIAVGSNGTILRAANAANGTTWTVVPCPVSTRLNAVRRSATNSAFLAVGDEGVILRSVDDGLTWQQLVSTTTENLNDAFGTVGSTWIVVGANGTILRSTDNGGSPVGLTEYVNGAAMMNVRVAEGMLIVDFEIDGSSAATLRVMDAVGREVVAPQLLGAASGHQQIRTPLPVCAGVFLVQLQRGEQRTNQRFVNPGQ